MENQDGIPRVGMIGFSGYAGVLLKIFQQFERRGVLKFVAVVVKDASEDQASVDDLNRRGVRIYSNFEEFLEREKDCLDLCCVPTGISTHARITCSKGEIIWKYEESCTIRYLDGREENLPSYTAFDARYKLVEHSIRRLREPSVFVATAAMAKEHTRLVADIHFHFPVSVIPRDQIDIIPINDGADKVPAIRGIASDMRAAFHAAGPLHRTQPITSTETA